MDGNGQVGELVLGGCRQGKIGHSYNAKKKKAITAVQLTNDGKIKRMYALKIENFPARPLQYKFINHISGQA